MPTLQANGNTVNYRFDGPESAPVIVLSNSLASNLAMWDLQVPALTAAGYRVLRYDTRGHGGTGVTPGPYTVDLLTEDTVALLDALDLDRVRFMGCSMGGMIGQMLATRHPERLVSVVLDATAAKVGPYEVWTERIETVRAQGMAPVVDATIDRWFTAAGQARLPDEVAKVREMVSATAPEGYCACATGIRDMDQTETIRAVTSPVLIIVGEEDQGTPVSAAELIHDRIAGSRLVVLEKAAHFVNVERSELYNETMLGFLGAAA